VRLWDKTVGPDYSITKEERYSKWKESIMVLNNNDKYRK